MKITPKDLVLHQFIRHFLFFFNFCRCIVLILWRLDLNRRPEVDGNVTRDVEQVVQVNKSEISESFRYEPGIRIGRLWARLHFVFLKWRKRTSQKRREKTKVFCWPLLVLEVRPRIERRCLPTNCSTLSGVDGTETTTKKMNDLVFRFLENTEPLCSQLCSLSSQVYPRWNPFDRHRDRYSDRHSFRPSFLSREQLRC